MTLVLFYLALALMLYTVFQMTRVNRLVLRHRDELLVHLGELVQDLPEAGAATRALLVRQQMELEALRPFWRKFSR